MSLRTAIVSGAVSCVLVVGAGTALAGPQGVTFARSCKHVKLPNGATAKVHVDGRATCNEGRRVARKFYARVGGPWDGKTGDGRIYYRIYGYRCTTGLGGSEGFCNKPHRSVDLSIR